MLLKWKGPLSRYLNKVHLSRKKPYPWDLMDIKFLHDFKTVAELIHVRQKSTMCIKCPGGPVPSEEGLGDHSEASWMSVCRGPIACLDQTWDSNSERILHWVNV